MAEVIFSEFAAPSRDLFAGCSAANREIEIRGKFAARIINSHSDFFRPVAASRQVVATPENCPGKSELNAVVERSELFRDGPFHPLFHRKSMIYNEIHGGGTVERCAASSDVHVCAHTRTRVHAGARARARASHHHHVPPKNIYNNNNGIGWNNGWNNGWNSPRILFHPLHQVVEIVEYRGGTAPVPAGGAPR